MQAFLAAHRSPAMCGLGVTGVPFYLTGGYTYLHRSVPLYFDDFTPVRHEKGSAVPLRFSVTMDGQSIREPPAGQLALEVNRFNYLIAPPGKAIDGFRQLECFGEAGSEICLFRRPGPCNG